MTEKYPYFIYPDVLALREGNCPQEEAVVHRRRIAANVGDVTALRLILGIDPEEFAEFYPDMEKVNLSTIDTIDTFLSRFGKSEGVAVPPAAAAIPGDVTPFEIGDAAEEVKMPADATTSAIDAFLSGSSGKEQKPDAQEPTTEVEIELEIAHEHPATLAEARKLIKNHNYEGALQIIMQLSLNNPEKSIYFADQIRFLRKLILNEAKKQ